MENEIFDQMLEKTFSQKEGIKRIKRKIIQLSEMVVDTMKNDGRIFFVGAGISSEIARIITEELWFNFSINRERFVILSAAKKFISEIDSWKELEEISSVSIFELNELKLNKNDLVIGITCTGKTEYVIGAIKYAKDLKCKIALITENGDLNENDFDLVLTSKLNNPTIFGLCSAEGATIQKLIIDFTLYTSMEKIGRIWKGHLIFMKPVSKKLYGYCIYTIMELLKIKKIDAEDLFEKNDCKLQQTILSYVKKISSEKASKLLEDNEFDFIKLIS